MTLAGILTVLFAKDHLLSRVVQKYRGRNMAASAAVNFSFNFMQHMLYPHPSSTPVQTPHSIASRSYLLLLGQLSG